jgi:hypothetical protein
MKPNLIGRRGVRLLALAFIAAMPPAAAFAEATRAAPSIAQAERNAVDLKQGMTPDEVQKLLGKPRRTALSAHPGYAGKAEQGTLQWTYVWAGGSSSSYAERSLQIDFAAKAADQWTVNSWGWAR